MRYKGVKFDDYTSDSVGSWSQVCKCCSDRFEDLNKDLEISEFGDGLCGIEGCYNEAEYYIDFVRTDLIEMEV